MELPDSLFQVPELVSSFKFDEKIIWEAYGSMGPAGVEEFIFSVEGETEELTQTMNTKLQALEHLIQAHSSSDVAKYVQQRLKSFPRDSLLYNWRKSIEISLCGGGPHADQDSKTLRNAVVHFIQDLDEASKLLSPSKL